MAAFSNRVISSGMITNLGAPMRRRRLFRKHRCSGWLQRAITSYTRGYIQRGAMETEHTPKRMRLGEHRGALVGFK